MDIVYCMLVHDCINLFFFSLVCNQWLTFKCELVVFCIKLMNLGNNLIVIHISYNMPIMQIPYKRI